MKRILLFVTLLIGYITAYSQTAVTTTNLHLREANSSYSKTLATIPKNTSIYLLGCENGWCQTT
jgi:hypothetical protein